MNPLAYDNVGTLLDRTTRLMKAHFTRAFRDAGSDLTTEQWVLLDQLRREGASSQTELANGTFKDAPTVSRIVDKLVQKGLASRTRFPNDRRRYQVALTEAGETTHAHLLPRVQALRVTAWRRLTEADYADLDRILGLIRENFGE